MKLTIHITKEILKESMYCKVGPFLAENMIGQNCAIGKAIYNLFGNKSWVTCNSIMLFTDGVKFKDEFLIMDSDLKDIELPLKAIEFIQAFDMATSKDRMNMDEFSFEIDLPDEAIDLLDISDWKGIIANTPTLSLCETF